MNPGLRSRVNQKLHQAWLLLEAAAHQADPLQEVAWQQACYEGAIKALEGAGRAFLKELASAYRLPPEGIRSVNDLQQLADRRSQTLPELVKWDIAARDKRHPLGQLNEHLRWMELQGLKPAAPSAPSTQGDIPLLVQEDNPNNPLVRLQQARDLHQGIKGLIETLRQGLYEE